MKDAAILLDSFTFNTVALFNQIPPGGETYEYSSIMYAKVENRFLISIQEN